MSLFSSLKPKADLSRSPFDLSRTETFSLKTGILTPVFVQHTIPDGRYKIDLSNIVRVDEMKQANFVGVSQNVEFCFVPYSQIWKHFNPFYYERGEQTRTPLYNQTNGLPVCVPTFSLTDVLYNLCKGILAHFMYSRYVEKWNDTDFIFSTLTADDIRSFGEYFEVVVGSDNYWYNTLYCDIHGDFAGYEMLRNLDMLGYGNYWPMIKTWLNFVESVFTITSDATYDKMLSDYDMYLATLSGERAPVNFFTQFPDERPNVFAIMAYAKFFSDVYRNREYDDTPYHQWYNCDWFAGLDTDSYVNYQIIFKALKPNFKQYKKDLFTGLYPNPQFGDVAIASYDHETTIVSTSPSTSSNTALVASSSSVSPSVPNGLVRSGVNGFNWVINSQISALAIRQAEALQRYKERIVRAGNREKDLQMAVFGVGSKYIQDEYVDFLGSFQGSLQNNPVAATADTENSVVGQLGSYSVGSISLGSNQEISFDSHDFGIIIGVMYILPETKYEAMGIHPQNTKFEKGDYFNPAFQNLGLQPVYNYEALNVGTDFNALSPSVLGYLARYHEYKTAVSRVHGEFFASTPNFIYGDGALSQDWQGFSDVLARFGAFSDFAAPRDVNAFSYPKPDVFYISPRDLDSVFYTSYNPLFAFDHFKVEMNFQVKAVLPMSVTGLPSY